MTDDDREVETDKHGRVEKVLAPSDDPGLPEATIDADVDRAPGGADATAMESDVGAGDHSSEELLTADQPLSAQTREVDVPDALQEPEDTDDDPEADETDPEASNPA